MEEQYLIESMEHTHGDEIYWWKPDRLGYTPFVDQAGRYSHNDAKIICENAGPKNERMWKESEVSAGRAGVVGTVVLKR